MSNVIPVHTELLKIIENLEITLKVIHRGIAEEKTVLSAIEDKINELIELTSFLKAGPTAVSLEEFTLIRGDIRHFRELKSKSLTALKLLNQNLNEKERELREVRKTAKKFEKKEKEGRLLVFKRKA